MGAILFMLWCTNCTLIFGIYIIWFRLHRLNDNLEKIAENTKDLIKELKNKNN